MFINSVLGGGFVQLSFKYLLHMSPPIDSDGRLELSIKVQLFLNNLNITKQYTYFTSINLLLLFV